MINNPRHGQYAMHYWSPDTPEDDLFEEVMIEEVIDQDHIAVRPVNSEWIFTCSADTLNPLREV
jgi:hypothetical protein